MVERSAPFARNMAWRKLLIFVADAAKEDKGSGREVGGRGRMCQLTRGDGSDLSDFCGDREPRGLLRTGDVLARC